MPTHPQWQPGIIKHILQGRACIRPLSVLIKTGFTARDKERERTVKHITVESFAFKTDMAALLEKRLLAVRGGETVNIMPGENSREVHLTVRDAQGEAALSEALMHLLLVDAARFRLAGRISRMSLLPGEKRRVIRDALRFAGEELGEDGMRALSGQLREYLSCHGRLNVEGFLLFRMKEYVHSLGRHVKTAVDLLIEDKCEELLRVLRLLLVSQVPKVGELSLILCADGSCIIADDSDSRIECEGCCGTSGREGELVKLLVSLAPESLSVYDLSCGRAAHLCGILRDVFADRVRFFL